MLLEPEDKPSPKPMSNKEFEDLLYRVQTRPTNEMKAKYFEFQQRIKANEKERNRASRRGADDCSEVGVGSVEQSDRSAGVRTDGEAEVARSEVETE